MNNATTNHADQPNLRFRVVDGMYSSDLFETLEDAQSCASVCKADEGHSGSVRIERFEVGDQGYGEVIEVHGTEGPNVLSKGARVSSEDARQWWQDESEKWSRESGEAIGSEE